MQAICRRKSTSRTLVEADARPVEYSHRLLFSSKIHVLLFSLNLAPSVVEYTRLVEIEPWAC